MNTIRTGSILMLLLLVVSAVAPAAVTAQSGELSIGVAQDDETGITTVTVSSNGTAVENATVNVTANETYTGTGEYETDANGVVSLPEPATSVTVTIEATHDNATATRTVDIDPTLGVTVEEAADGSAVVTVTRGNDTVQNASVNVTTQGTETYAGTGEYETDANGTVTLANPDDPAELTITAEADGETATTSVVVQPVETLAVGVQQDDSGTVTVSVGRLGEPVANATVEVTAESGSYAGTGAYETDGSGTVALPAPTENVTVTVTATDDGETATTTKRLQPPEPVGPFGQIVSVFVDTLKSAGFSGPLGQQVSDFVTSNNPSNASERGPPSQAGPDGDDSDAEGNDTRVVPAEPPVDAPGNSGSAPGQADDPDTEDEREDAPGNSGSAPGRTDDTDTADDASDDDPDTAAEDEDAPGNSGSAPGQSEEAGDDEDDGEDTAAEDGDAPGNSGSAPGQSTETDTADDTSDDDDADTEDEREDAPGNSGSAPGQSDDASEDDTDTADDDDDGENGNGNGR